MDAYISLGGSYTRRELLTINEFKEYCANQNLIYRFDIYTNDFLIKFLRSTKYNIKATFTKFVNYLKFVDKFQIYSINEIAFPNTDKIKIFYPHNFHSITKDGNPILIQNLGELKINDINRILPNELLDKYIIKNLEILNKKIFPACSVTYNKNIDKVFCIVDLLGLSTSLMHKNIFDFVNKQLKIVTNYYPCILDNMYFLNTSLIFRSIWATCKYFYDEDTRNKIFLLGYEYKNKLFEKINPLNLPKLFGGECNCEPYGCIFSNKGPWNENDPDYKKSNNIVYNGNYEIKNIDLNEEKLDLEENYNVNIHKIKSINEINDMVNEINNNNNIKKVEIIGDNEEGLQGFNTIS